MSNGHLSPLGRTQALHQQQPPGSPSPVGATPHSDTAQRVSSTRPSRASTPIAPPAAHSPHHNYSLTYHRPSTPTASSRPHTPSTRPARPSKLSNMTASSSHHQQPAQQSYYHNGAQPHYLANVQAADPSQGSADLQVQPWMTATMIEDDDLTFGGKPLSTWYEEDRRRLSVGGDDEEETRGRQRVREQCPPETETHHHHQSGHGHKKNEKKR